MTEKLAQRRLAGILVADVVGYSRLMELDEAGTWRHLLHAGSSSLIRRSLNTAGASSRPWVTAC
jgi:class 3 adenylate cyclase